MRQPAAQPSTPANHGPTTTSATQLSHTDRRGNTSNFVYDSFNRVVAAYDPLLDGQSARGVVRTSYDDAGNRVSQTNQDGATTQYSYDALNRLRAQTQLVRQPDGTTAADTTTFGYDDLGDQTSATDPAGDTSTATFDPAGEQLTATDANNDTTSYSYDLAGRQTGSTDPLGRSWTRSYDLAGRLTTENHYDHTGALLTTVGYGYDPASNQTTVTNARGYTSTLTYDSADQLTAVTQPVTDSHSTTTTAGYDPAGNMTRFTDGDGNTTIRTYTSWNAPESTIEPPTPGQTDPADRTWTTSYDAGGLPVTETQPGGVTITHTYDALGRLVGDSGSGGGTTAATRTFGYDLAGLRTSLSTPTGTDTYNYDDRGLLTNAAGPSGTATFGYDNAGRISTSTGPAGTVNYTYNTRSLPATVTDTLSGTSRDYSYDNADQLTSISIAGPNNSSSTRTFGYDDLGRLTSDQLAQADGTITASTSYGYDPNGNLTSKTVALPNNPASGANTYSYDQQDRLTSWTNPNNVTTSYGWDDAGNRTQAGATTYSYDARNRLTGSSDGTTNAWTPRGDLATTTSTGGTTNYGYDAFSRLTTATAGGATVNYSYDSLDRLLTRNSDTVTYTGTSIKPSTDGIQTYTRTADDALLAVNDGTTTTTTLAGVDRHHDLSYLANPDGTVAASQVYDPFGTVVGDAGTFGVSLGYQSDLTDTDTGQVWMGARWYAPTDDSFTSQDSLAGNLAEPESLNRYTYAGGNPLSYFDPDGHSRLCDCGSTDAVSSSAAQAGAPKGPKFVRPLELSNPPLHGNDVKWVQQRLNRYGAHLITDGVFGAHTSEAVHRFQTANGLSSDGTVGPKTWRKLASGSAADIRWPRSSGHAQTPKLPIYQDNSQWFEIKATAQAKVKASAPDATFDVGFDRKGVADVGVDFGGGQSMNVGLREIAKMAYEEAEVPGAVDAAPVELSQQVLGGGRVHGDLRMNWGVSVSTRPDGVSEKVTVNGGKTFSNGVDIEGDYEIDVDVSKNKTPPQYRFVLLQLAVAATAIYVDTGQYLRVDYSEHLVLLG